MTWAISMRFREIVRIISLLFLAAGGTEIAEAAQCRGTPPISDRFESSVHVFLAKIISAQVADGRNGEILNLYFEVIESYKGEPTRVRFTADSGAHVERSNYREISVGAYYVFFTHAAGTIHLGFCSRPERVLYENMRVSSIVEELRKLAIDAT